MTYKPKKVRTHRVNLKKIGKKTSGKKTSGKKSMSNKSRGAMKFDPLRGPVESKLKNFKYNNNWWIKPTAQTINNVSQFRGTPGLLNPVNNAFRTLQPKYGPPVTKKVRKTHRKPIQKIPSEGSSGSVYHSAESEFAPPIPEWIPSEESLSSKNKGSFKKKKKSKK